jgi:hypothetical protein
MRPPNHRRAFRRVRPPPPIEPPAPDSRSFGLADDRVRKFHQPIPESTSVLFAIPATILILKGSGASLIWMFLPFSYIPAFLVGLVAVDRLARMWRERQPDFDSYQQFRSAHERYKAALAAYNRKLEAWRGDELKRWRRLSGRGFEVELAKLYKSRGYRVKLNRGTGDGGVDLIVERHGQSFLVQCKAYQNPVGPAPVRELLGTLTHHNYALQGWLVTTSSFSKAARAFAEGKPLRLITILELLEEAPD